MYFIFVQKQNTKKVGNLIWESHF